MEAGGQASRYSYRVRSLSGGGSWPTQGSAIARFADLSRRCVTSRPWAYRSPAFGANLACIERLEEMVCRAYHRPDMSAR
jgi:hypothetical protein